MNNLFAELPKGSTPRQIRHVLAAIADKVRAEAMMKAVETGQVQVMVMQGGQPAVPIIDPSSQAPTYSSQTAAR